MLGVLGKLLRCSLQLPAKELGGGPAMEYICHRDKQGARGLIEDRGEGVREGGFVRVKEDGQIGEN